MVSTWYATIIIEDIIKHTAQAYCTMGKPFFIISTGYLQHRQQWQQGYMMLSEE
jgi:hypothetical protein